MENPPKKIHLRFEKIAETKGTFRYKEVTDGPMVLRNVYCEKWWCRGAQTLFVTVEIPLSLSGIKVEVPEDPADVSDI